jgi:uncharacterized protein involved in outer membrane biogenesis
MPGSWYRSKLFLVVAVLVVLVVVALLAAPYLFDLNRYKPMIVSQLGKATGRMVELGNLRLHFLPSLQVVVNDLKIKNPPGFPEGDTVAVDQVDLGLALGPLLSRQVQITGVTLENPVLNLLANERGENNSESLLQAKKSGNGATQADGNADGNSGSAVAISRIDAVSVENARITSGSFWRREKRVYPQWEVKGINLEASGIDLSDADWMSKLRAEMALGTVEVSSPALKEPLRFTDGEITVRDNKAEGDFSLALGPIRARGNVNVPNLERGEAARFTLAANELDVTAVGALVAGGKAAAGGPRRAGDPNKLLARGDVNVDQIVVPPLTTQNVKANVRLYATRLELDPFSFNLYKGRTQGTLALDLAGESMQARANAKVEGVDVAQLLAAVSPGGQSKVTGTFEADARLGAPLAAADPISALSGDGTFAVRDGVFPGLDVQGTLAKMAQLMQIEVPTGDTKFSRFGGDFRIANQRIHSDRLQLDAEALEAELRGSVGFDQTVSYSGTGLLRGQGTAKQEEQKSSSPLGGLRRVFGKVVQQTMSISGMRVPFSVRGTLQNLQIVPGGVPQPIPR